MESSISDPAPSLSKAERRREWILRILIPGSTTLNDVPDLTEFDLILPARPVAKACLQRMRGGGANAELV
ncbi:hypothetical protein M3484_13810 [Pseudomonas sp. GX19020]|uniref:hypothetical protein n=1 Tax=Pseudomonas sp. GX19020 TaxID=2942277 RepID=UPI002018A8AE|nr:hypothetical protein [Pseudomonas sp. GX19020]MCL4067648.1 hypothetical protein [Pseudomonas sp. GX19020]